MVNINILYRSIIKIKQNSTSEIFISFCNISFIKDAYNRFDFKHFMSIASHHKSFELMFPMLMLTSTFWHRISQKCPVTRSSPRPKHPRHDGWPEGDSSVFMLLIKFDICARPRFFA